MLESSLGPGPAVSGFTDRLRQCIKCHKKTTRKKHEADRGLGAMKQRRFPHRLDARPAGAGRIR